MKRTIHLICNAHLDPVWLWEWQEGAAETVSTFRTAAELCENNDAFVFNHNEVILYEWIQEYEPSLFKRIQKLVKKGRWHIMGGWYIQPDCNMPSGESLVRQILAGRKYFKKYFGVRPTTAINFDSFGHSRGLVQILAKSGYDSYLFGRPVSDFMPLENDLFTWIGFDGSKVLAKRFTGGYNTYLGKAAKTVSERIEGSNDPIEAVLWGVGNHGGGPSRKDLADLNKLIENRKDINISHSTPDKFFQQLYKSKTVREHRKEDLNPWAIGCYTSMIRIKQKHRQLENELYLTEKMASSAAANKLMDYPQEDFEAASRDLQFSQFHDLLPGTSIQPSEEAVLDMIGHGLEILSRIKTKAFFALASGQKKAKKGNIPIFVFNPHPHELDQIVECEFNLPEREASSFMQVNVSQNTRPVAAQSEQELSSFPKEWRKRIAFKATLKPGQMNRFDCNFVRLPKKPSVRRKTSGKYIICKNEQMQVKINTRTGFIDQYRVDGMNYLDKNAFCPVVLHDNEDPWEVSKVRFGKTAGRFKLLSRDSGTKFCGFDEGQLDSVRIIEDGDVRTVVEAVFGYEESFIAQRYLLPKQGTEIGVEMRVYWNQKNKMLKLQVPLAFEGDSYLGQTAFGVQELPTNGNEAVAQKWVAVTNKKTNQCISCINNGIYGSDCSNRKLRLSLLRAPAYSAHPLPFFETLVNDRFIPRIDQGERIFKFWFKADSVRKRLRQVSTEALAHNEKPFALSFFHSGDGRLPKPMAIVDNQAIEISALKKAHGSNCWIVRLFNTTGQKQTAQLKLPVFKRSRKLIFGMFEVKTLMIDAKGKIKDVNLMEEAL